MADVPKHVILSSKLVRAALGDPEFYSKLPEFVSMKLLLKTTYEEYAKNTGCGHCKRARLLRMLVSSFVGIASQLDDDAKTRMRTYYNVPGLMVNVIRKPGTAAELIVI